MAAQVVECKTPSCPELGKEKIVNVMAITTHATGEAADVKVQGTLICTSCGGDLDVFGIGG